MRNLTGAFKSNKRNSQKEIKRAKHARPARVVRVEEAPRGSLGEWESGNETILADTWEKS